VEYLRTANEEHSQPGGRCVIDFIVVLSATQSADLESGYVIGYSRIDPVNGRTFPHHYYPVRGEPGLQGPLVLTRGADSFAFWFASILNHLAGVIAYPPNLYRYLGLPFEIFQV
jgi:hypothetical protein